MQERAGAVLSIAGYDPSGGAGVLADVKAFEQLGVRGMAVNTCLTYQNDIAFEGADWHSLAQIEWQLRLLHQRFQFFYIKIGLVQSLEALVSIMGMLKVYAPETKIIWDPILKASAGFVFHAETRADLLRKALGDIYLITPNQEEMNRLCGSMPLDVFRREIAPATNILIKSYAGNDTTGTACDLLLMSEAEWVLENDYKAGAAKHGSGCVLSAALTAFLHKGYALPEACRLAKEYTHAFLLSDKSMLGFHHNINVEAHVEQ